MASPPREAATEGLQPGVGGDGDDECLAERMKDGAEPALAEPVGDGEAEGENDGDFDPKNRIAGKEGQEKERAEEKEPTFRKECR